MTGPDYSNLGLKDLLVSLDGPVAVTTINRAKQRNTFSNDVAWQLIELFSLFDKDDRVRAVILTADASAPAFCSGADLSKGWSDIFAPEVKKEGMQAHRDPGGLAALAIHRCRKVTICAVNGHAVGVGMTIQLPFDFRLAWEGAKLAFPFVRRGITPEAISTYFLPRLIGLQNAKALMLTGQTLNPTSPYITSLYHQTFPNRTDVFPAALKFAHDLAVNTSVPAVALTKAMLWHGTSSPEEQHMLESRIFGELVQGEDGREGAIAFLEKREPRFGGTLSKDLPDLVPWVEGDQRCTSRTEIVGFLSGLPKQSICGRSEDYIY